MSFQVHLNLSLFLMPPQRITISILEHQNARGPASSSYRGSEKPDHFCRSYIKLELKVPEPWLIALSESGASGDWATTAFGARCREMRDPERSCGEPSFLSSCCACHFLSASVSAGCGKNSPQSLFLLSAHNSKQAWAWELWKP